MWFGFFPYLRTSERISIQGLDLCNCRDLERLAPDASKAIQTLAPMFCLHDGTPIQDVTYVVPDDPGEKEAEQEKTAERLQRVQTLLAYIYTTPQRWGETALTAEHASFFLFRPEQVPILLATPGRARDSEGKLIPGSGGTGSEPGYHGLRDWECPFWVIDRCKIYPEFPFFWQHESQDISRNGQEFFSSERHRALSVLLHPNPPLPTNVLELVYTSMRWYVASCRNRNNEPEAIVSLSIALESLLHVRHGDRLTERFKDAVLTVIGPVPRLEEWIEQFYNARSKIVHEGRHHHLVFFVPKPPSPKRPKKEDADGAIVHGRLLAYGRRIYRMCLSTILTGARLAAEEKLADLFVNNKERLKNICATLSQKGKPSLTAIGEASADMRGLAEFSENPLEELVKGVDAKELWGAAKLVLQHTEKCVTALSSEEKEVIAEALHASGFDTKQIERLNRIRSFLISKIDMNINQEEQEAILAIAQFLSYVLSPGLSVQVALSAWRADKKITKAKEESN
jgi:uncharacterized protein (UPF0335 family)